jgi:hypothetical protein
MSNLHNNPILLTYWVFLKSMFKNQIIDWCDVIDDSDPSFFNISCNSKIASKLIRKYYQKVV